MNIKIELVKNLSALQRERMFELMAEYYENVSRTEFLSDLEDKQKVIVLSDSNEQIQGFSTIFEKAMLDHRGKKKFIAIFSGDTVLAKPFWRNGALGKAFSQYLARKKFRNSKTPVYWFLISKGFRTYLQMANNFTVYFPRHDRPAPPKYQTAMDLFYSERFKNKYDPKRGLITSDKKEKSFVREDKTQMTPDLLRNAKIKFFQECNPEWMNGDELACIAEVNFATLARYPVKRLLRRLKRL